MRVFVTRKIPGEHLAGLEKAGHEVVVSLFDRPLTPEELTKFVVGADGILTLLTDGIDGDVMDAAGPALCVISNYAVGFDNIDVDAATSRGIVVTNTPCDEVNIAVAEHTWALILSCARRVVEADEATRRGAYRGWEPDIFLGTSLKGKNLGIVGLGRIGKMVAQIAKGFEMNVFYYSRTQDKEAEKELLISHRPFPKLLASCDFVSLHVPLTDETRHMINTKTLSVMKKGSFLVNTARGPVVDETDLVSSIRSGHLGGAALDVFDNEPNINPELYGMANVITTPHIASATRQARHAMGKMATKALTDVFSGKKPENIVNEKVWEHRRK